MKVFQKEPTLQNVKWVLINNGMSDIEINQTNKGVYIRIPCSHHPVDKVYRPKVVDFWMDYLSVWFILESCGKPVKLDNMTKKLIIRGVKI